ncbi:hypothetical protein GCM10010505_24620 [Kitasatospora aburaviensis]
MSDKPSSSHARNLPPRAEGIAPVSAELTLCSCPKSFPVRHQARWQGDRVREHLFGPTAGTDPAVGRPARPPDGPPAPQASRSATAGAALVRSHPRREPPPSAAALARHRLDRCPSHPAAAGDGGVLINRGRAGLMCPC